MNKFGNFLIKSKAVRLDLKFRLIHPINWVLIPGLIITTILYEFYRVLKYVRLKEELKSIIKEIVIF